jgi:hypothetical protein
MIYNFKSEVLCFKSEVFHKFLTPKVSIIYDFLTPKVSIIYDFLNSSIPTFFLILFLLGVFLNYVYLQKVSKIFNENDFSDIKNLFRLVDSNFSAERARYLLNLQEIREAYYKKFAAVKNSNGLTSINSFNTTFVSHYFFNVIEFTVAEKCILCAYTLKNLNNKINRMKAEGKVPFGTFVDPDDNTKIFENKITDMIHDYVMLWPKNEHAAAFSLFNRIMKNLTFIDFKTDEVCRDKQEASCVSNAETIGVKFDILKTIKKIYEKRFNFKAHHFINYITNESISQKSKTLWRPDLELKLKNLNKMDI